MALINHLERRVLQVETQHKEAEATYSIVKDRNGAAHLQIDSYGSSERKLQGKQSQSIRLTPIAIAELKEILARYFA